MNWLTLKPSCPWGTPVSVSKNLLISFWYFDASLTSRSLLIIWTSSGLNILFRFQSESLYLTTESKAFDKSRRHRYMRKSSDWDAFSHSILVKNMFSGTSSSPIWDGWMFSLILSIFLFSLSNALHIQALFMTQ